MTTIRPISQQILRMSGTGTDPDPAIYCPAHGYYDPNAPYTPDPDNIEIPALSDQQIILLCSSELDSAINLTVNISNTGQYNVKIYGDSETLLSNTNTNNGSVFFYNFIQSQGVAHPDGYSTFRVVISPTIGTNVITNFALTAKTGYAAYGWPIIEAYLKAPNLTALATFMANQSLLKYVQFDGPNDLLTTLQYFCDNCPQLEQCILPTSMNGCTALTYAFRTSISLKSITIPNSLPACTSLISFCQASGIKAFILFSSLPVITDISNMYNSVPGISGEIILPNMPNLTTAQAAFGNCVNITALRFTGAHDSLWSFINLAYNNTRMTEIELPSSMNGFNCTVNNSANGAFNNCPALKKIIMPLSMNYTAYTGIGTGLFYNMLNLINLEEITRCNTTWGSKPFSFLTTNCKKLATFYHPEANIYSFVMNGFSSANRGALNSLELNWNNLFNEERTGAQIQIQYCSFDTNELNRIFTALPNLISTGNTGTMTCSQNPGYAAATKTIATAKGWNIN